MKMFKLFFISILLSAILNADVHAQKNDTLIVGKDSINAKKITTDSISKKDSLILKKKSRDPGKASLYSAILPGWAKYITENIGSCLSCMQLLAFLFTNFSTIENGSTKRAMHWLWWQMAAILIWIV